MNVDHVPFTGHMNFHVVFCIDSPWPWNHRKYEKTSPRKREVLRIILRNLGVNDLRTRMVSVDFQIFIEPCD